MASLFDRVVEVLAPDLGDTTARASVRMFLFKEFRVAPENLKPEHLGRLAERIRPGLKVFVGGARADSLAQRIQQLNEGGPQP